MSEGNLEVFVDLPRRKEKALAGTWAAHLRNMNKGLSEGLVPIEGRILSSQ